MENLKGVVERVTFHSPETGWTVLKVSAFDDPERLSTVVIHQAKVFAGATVQFQGEWTRHPKHGEQFKATSAVEMKPASTAALEKYLGSGLIHGVGPATARRIVSYFGDRTLEVFEKRIDELKNVSGIAEKKLVQIRTSWEEHRSIRDVMIFLQGHGISTLFAVKIYKAYGDRAIEIVSKNPYRLANDIYGIGFFSADRIAIEMGFAADGLPRIEAGIRHVLLTSRENGHCFLTEGQILSGTRELLRQDLDEQNILSVLEDLLARDEIKSRKISRDLNTELCYYDKGLYLDELMVAERLKELMSRSVQIDKERVELWVEKHCEKNQITLSDEQKAAVCGIVAHSFSILTGGPGCGKTTTTRVLVQLLQAMKKRVLLAAPTGRAAQRMSEVIGAEAKTLHRLLEWTPELGGFQKNEDVPLEADFLVVDECSMLDISLAASVVRAVPPTCQLLFIGDPDQLPSVGAGAVLGDLLKARAPARFSLTKVFRQAAQSAIIRFAHEINAGKTPEIVSPLAEPTAAASGMDCLFIDSTPDHPFTSQKYGLDAADSVVRLYTKSIKEWQGPDAEIQVLTPQVRGTLGTMSLNQRLQYVHNPPAPHKKQLQFNERILRVGDRVIQTRNNYDLSVYNGDIGKIVDVDTEEQRIKIRFVAAGEERIVTFEREDLSELSLAYAITIHKSQGSEFQAVIIPIDPQHSRMLFRNLIYTGLTRAKKLAVFVGNRKTLTQAIRQIDSRERQTALTQLIDFAL